MTVMTFGVMAMAREVPHSLRAGLVAGCARWFAGMQPERSLTRYRVECWKFLDAKHGNSTTVADREDMAVRALICILWDKPHEGGHLAQGLDYFAHLAEEFGVLDPALGLSD